ncbi:MAG: peptide-methionine (R)-S-oxide reductase, partial [Sphingobacteriaceae bacterium]
MKRLILIAITAASVSLFGCQNINGQSKTSTSQPKRKIVKTETEWKKQLSPTAYEIMVERGTEAPFKNAYY